MKARFDAVNMLKEKKTEIQKLYWFQIWAPIRDLKDVKIKISYKILKFQDIADLHERQEQIAAKKTEFQAVRDNLLVRKSKLHKVITF